MKKILGIFATAMLALLAGAATAAITNIAQVPLLNITGTGNVRPNIMLLYDNSGSMAWNYVPDNVNDSTTCRAAATMGAGTSANPRTTRACTVGNPPFNSADFNHQYYNPAVTYTPPIKWDGSSYAAQTRAATGAWTSVTTDGFGINKTDLNGTNANATNLATGFPDLRWCDGNGNCGYNTATYTYPDNSKTTPQAISSNPYYYTINVAEYCTDKTLRVCQSVNVGAPAPTGYPEPAKVRWCDSPALTNCQAKYLEDATGKTTQFIYPRYGNPNGGVVAAYGTITIGASANAGAVPISSVTVTEPSGAVVITNGAVTAAGGTNTLDKQQALATDLAASINVKTGLTNSYAACVKTPSGNSINQVAACSTYGINLSAVNVVAVIPIDCLPGTTVKNASVCSVLPDSSRNGWALSVNAPSTAIQAARKSYALITLNGSANANRGNAENLPSIKLGSTSLLPNGGLTFGLGVADSDMASAIAKSIGKNGTITAYTSSTAPADCGNIDSSTVCLVNTAANAASQSLTVGALSNNTYTSRGKTYAYVSIGTTQPTSPQAEVDDAIPVTTTPLGAGAAIFVRTDIVPGVNSYPKAPTRTDCAGAACTYDEEMTNFANWYAYYKTRNQMMKTSVGLAFQALNANYNVGIVSLSAAAAQQSMTLPRQFSGADRSNWYSTLYGMSTSGATPMRQALHAVGLMYANQKPYVQSAGSEVVSAPCQPNFTFVTTDGYWNGGAAATVANNDNVESTARFCTRASGCFDPRANDATLADVALYWYNGGSNSGTVSLRPSIDDMDTLGLVPAASNENRHLHMTTYTLGLGVDGIMTYDPNYAQATSGDFYKLVTGVTSGCPWNNNGAYVWPDAVTSDTGGGASYQSRVDDLWHTAINGHGKYFSAADPTAVVASLNTALANIQTRTGAAAAAATSTPNISMADNDIFSATFTTVEWYGELTDRKIDPVSGQVGTAISWSTTSSLIRKTAVDPGTGLDGRKIYMRNAASGQLQNFVYASLTATEKSWFTGKCTLLTQCATLASADRAIVDNGTNMVNWLRGQQTYADDNHFRAYGVTPNDSPVPGVTAVLGDIASAKPAYQREPRKGYTFGNYDAFRTKWAKRTPAVFVAANDGMLHAFSAADGSEMWAYAPRITMSKLFQQASTTYGTNHQFTTDGSPEIGDVQFGDGSWHSVLVAGLNAGGRGYYALDVTDPANPKALWEICADTALCGSDSRLQNLGLTFADPQFGTYKDSAGTHWAVFLTSGYNNVSGTDNVASGDGHGYLYVIDVTNGAVLAASCTAVPGTDCSKSTDTPTGLAKVTVITANPTGDPQVTYVYGGDNQGNMWRFDFTQPGAPPAPLLMGAAVAGSVVQPITSRPEVTMCAVTTTDANKNKSTSAQRVVAFGTGRLLDVPDLTNTDKQSVYVLKDSGTGIAAGAWRGANMAQRTLAKTADKNSNSYTIGGAGVDLGSQLGWYFDLNQNAGERVNLDPKVVSGTLSVVTNIPTSSSACTIGGTSNVYQLDVCTGAAVAVDNSAGGTSGTGTSGGTSGGTTGGTGTGNSTTLIAGGTLSASSAAVGYIIVRLPSGALKMITTFADGSTATSSVVPAKSMEAHRAGWRRVRD